MYFYSIQFIKYNLGNCYFLDISIPNLQIFDLVLNFSCLFENFAQRKEFTNKTMIVKTCLFFFFSIILPNKIHRLCIYIHAHCIFFSRKTCIFC